MQAGEVGLCWWKQCFKGIFARVSVQLKKQISYFDKL